MLTDHQIAQFHRTGYLSLEQVIGLVDVHRVRELLDGLFARFHELPKNKALDLGDEMRPQGGHQIAEINRTIRLEPRLKQTLAFIKCREIAGQLLGQTAYYSYDHAIYKPPRNQRATPWHQDQAYTGHTLSMGTIHFWLAMQDVNEDNGCMQYIPYSHMEEILPHRRRTPKAHALVADPIDTTQAVTCPLSAGGVTIHHPATLHYSGPNNTDALRRAWVLIFSPYGRISLLHPIHLLAKVKALIRDNGWRSRLGPTGEGEAAFP